MIYTREQSEVEVLGDVQKFKVGIDTNNINHIVTILSSNLYSHPLESFLRETVSNAVDSHKEAGVEEPIIITRTKDSLSIRDFGTGISPERFQEIYLNIGSSTKRESNSYIGSFGIGRFSCLSVSNLANITSFYQGKAYYYVMNKDIDQLHIDLLYEKDTKEANGVEVKIPFGEREGLNLRCLRFIDNVYVHDEIQTPHAEDFNKRTIHSFKNFKITDLGGPKPEMDTEILLGKIPYKVDYNCLWPTIGGRHFYWKDTFKKVLPCINIGEVDITPNREALIYTERTKAVLRKVYDACIEELTELWNKQCDKEYDCIRDYIMDIHKHYYNILQIGNLKIELSSKLPFNIHFKNRRNWDNLSLPFSEKEGLIGKVVYTSLEALCEIEGNTMHQGSTYNKASIKHIFNTWTERENRIILSLPSRQGFSGKFFKDFLDEKYPKDYKLILKHRKVTAHFLKQLIQENIGISTLSNVEVRIFLFQLGREILSYLKDKVVVTDVINSPEYIQYKKAHTAPKQKNNYSTEVMTITYTETQSGNQDKHTHTINDALYHIRRQYRKCRVVYSELDNPFFQAFYDLNYPGLLVLSVAKGKMKYLQKGLPDWIRPIEELYSPDNRVLQKIAALRDASKDYNFANWYHLTLGMSWFPQNINENMAALGRLDKYRKCLTASRDNLRLLDIVDADSNRYYTEYKALLQSVMKYAVLQSHIGRDLWLWYALRKKIRLNLKWCRNQHTYLKEILEKCE